MPSMVVSSLAVVTSSGDNGRHRSMNTTVTKPLLSCTRDSGILRFSVLVFVMHLVSLHALWSS